MFAIGLPFVAAVTWGLFRVPEDSSARGVAPVPVPGFVRLLLELGLLAFAAWGLYEVGMVSWAAGYAGAIVVHYLLSYDRIGWLLRH